MSRPEIEVATLNECELLALHALINLRPDVTEHERAELRALCVGMTNPQVNVKVKIGIECFQKRGAVVPVLKDGVPVIDPANGLPMMHMIAKFIVRTKEIDVTKLA